MAVIPHDITTAGRQRLAVSRFLVAGHGALADDICDTLHRHSLAFDQCGDDPHLAGVLSAYDVVIDAGNNPIFSDRLNLAAWQAVVPLVHIAISSQYGATVATFTPPAHPCYACMDADDARDGAAPHNALIMAAADAVACIISRPKLAGRQWREKTNTIVALTPRDTCPVCAHIKTDLHNSTSSPVCAATRPPEITQQSLTADMQLVDIRERQAWKEGHIPAALHIPYSIIKRRPDVFAQLAPHKYCVLYCDNGVRSLLAAEMLLRHGYTGIAILDGGYNAYKP